ncbi:MAG: large-conductance mechanosensitive channel protein MscL [Sphaerochaeta sp.]|jgi:large conductance mechanosensitive channel|nr:large-conductance mechanosensitive channel protein MscL [Sphaerochaeta sp.]
MPKKSTFFNEFKTFISRGSVMDMAVGIIVGTAFTAIVNSLVKDMLMPIIGLILGGVSFTDLKFVIAAATDQTAEVAINWGTFIQRIVDFLIISFVVFVMVRSLNTLRDKLEPKKEEEAPAPEAPPAPPADVVLLTEIRDLLKKNA